jgi:predicted lipoprotein with Yx(FWY)xxD motif
MEGQSVEADGGASGVFDSIETATGLQVTYNGAPLYYFAADAAPGDTNGHLVGNVWFLARPETASTAYVGVRDTFLVGPTGMTLYLFANDTEGVSNCSGQCLDNWPALTVPEGLDPTAGSAAAGARAVVSRDDGALQITYNGLPVYYFAGASLPGDTTGDGVGGVWSLATP